MKIKANGAIKSEVKKVNNDNNIEDRATFFYYMFRNILLVGLPLLIISGLALSLSCSSATDSSSNSDSLAITISSSCTLSSVVNAPHVTEVYNGHYKDNIGTTTIKTLCNDGNGYAIYANGYSNNEEGNNKLINSEYPQYSIDTGLATSGLTSAWAMKLNNIENDPSPTPPVIEQDYNNTYGIVPNYWTKVAYRQSGTTDMSQGSSFTTTYAVYASSSQFAGTYLGQVKYLLTHPASPPAFRYMQDVAKWQNEIPNAGDTLLATDARDNKEYWVTRLADGHIWMTQNLDTDINSSISFNSNNTDLNVVYDVYTDNYREYKDGYTINNSTIYWTPISSATTMNFTGTTIAGWKDSDIKPYSANKTDDIETGHSSLGNYYNWTAAIASNNSSSLTSNTLNNISNNPQNSICPKGWRLPTISNASTSTAGSTNELGRLGYLYSDVLVEPLKFVKTGYISSTKLLGLSSGAVYPSSTIYSGSGVYGGEITGNILRIDAWANNYSGRRGGWPIRCLARTED